MKPGPNVDPEHQTPTCDLIPCPTCGAAFESTTGPYCPACQHKAMLRIYGPGYERRGTGRPGDRTYQPTSPGEEELHRRAQKGRNYLT